MRGGTPIAVAQNGVSLQVSEGEEGLLWCASSAMVAERKEKGRETEKLLLEPRSVLESRRSPSPPSSSASTLSSSLVVGGGGRSASSDGSAITATPSAAAEGTTELLPVPASLACDLEGLFCEPAASVGEDQNFLGWIISEAEETSGGGNFDSLCVFEGASVSPGTISLPPLASPVTSPRGFERGIPNPNLCLAPSAGFLPLLLPPLPAELHLRDEKHLLPNQEHQAQQPQLFPSFFLPFHQQSTTYHRDRPWKHLALPTRKRPAVDPFPTSRVPELLCQNLPHQIGFRRQLDAAGFRFQPPSVKPKLASGDEPSVAAATTVQQQQQQQQRILFDQLFEVAELIEAGNAFSARGILTRLNHLLPSSPSGKPLLRSAFYFKEALHLLAGNSPHPLPPPVSTPLDALLKFATYKTFSDVSPIAQFTSLTCVQAILEALDGASCIHIIDFDIGVGVQWSVLMQELVHRSSAVAAPPCLKITAFTSPCSHHPLELHLIRQNLLQFARSLGLVFEFYILDLEPFDPSAILRMRSASNEAVAVNLPVGPSIDLLILHLLRFLKQLSPKILVCVDYGYDRIDLPYGHNILSSIRSCILLLDSIDAAGTDPDAANKIERFFVRPRIQSAVFRHHHHLSNKKTKTVSWRSLFTSTGFVPVQFSNIAETQAECLLKRVLVQGFSIDRGRTSLSLCWQRGELASVSAWK